MREGFSFCSLAYPLLTVLAAVSVGGCRPDTSLPDPTSETYVEAVSAFYTGLSAMEVGADEHAEAELLQATRLVPGEPAAWANLGLLALRRNEFDVAAERFHEAAGLAPGNSQIALFLGLLESNRGRLDEAMAHLRRAIELDSTNLKAMYALAQEIERQGTAGTESEIARWLDQILLLDQDNLAVLLEIARLSARSGDADKLRGAVARLAELESSWPVEAREQLEALEAAASRSDLRLAATQVAFVRNVLLSLAAYREDLAVVQTPATQVGEPIEHFLRLAQPSATPAPPDDSIIFVIEPLPLSDTQAWEWVGAAPLNGEGLAAVFVANGRQLRMIGGPTLPFPGGPSTQPPSTDGVIWLDINYDFRMDLALAGAAGFRLYRQDTAAGFTDVTVETALPASVTHAPYTSAWAADLDLDGDMDIVLGVQEGPPRVLRNNGDGTFIALPLFQAIDGLDAFVWADLDADGDPDAGLLDGTGALHLFANERGGRFLEQPLPRAPGEGEVLAITATDADSDGVIDLIVFDSNGTIQQLSGGRSGGDWLLRELARWPDLAGASVAGPARLFVADLDNNGGLDLAASASLETRIWLQGADAIYEPIPTVIAAQIFAVAALNEEGRLDLLGLSRAGQPVVLRNRGTKPYHWTLLRPRAAEAAGDQRINSFGIGGEVELRTGLLFQKQPITQPNVHFGLGENVVGDVARIVWPNGIAQAEFDLQPEQSLLAIQRLKGSCPWLFTYDGSEMRFVTDFLWRSPLGMRINAQETAGVATTEDWVKIRRDQLVPRDGYYDLRVTAELWETHFFDHVSLMVVDHPRGTEIFVDERFAFPPPPLTVHVTGPVLPVARAWDDRGVEVTETIRARDERYLDTFGRGSHQGVTRDHYVEVELGDKAPRTGPLWLVASAWVRPTDSSINVALSQGRQDPPRGLRLEIPDGRGGWMVARDGLGFPAGKSKTVLIDLQNLFPSAGARRFRLRTNLEIYWDQLALAVGRSTSEMTTQRIAPETADLRFRGFSEVHEADRSSPEYPSYERLAGTTPLWRDLIGYYTRYGDVRELLGEIDDRYVIMNAGDEMAFRFRAPAPPPEGWLRDFVLIGDGWVKDGDYNTAFSKTVLPLPAHDRPDYTAQPGRLEDDPVFRRNSSDWQQYHTRYVTPQPFRNALIPKLREP